MKKLILILIILAGGLLYFAVSTLFDKTSQTQGDVISDNQTIQQNSSSALITGSSSSIATSISPKADKIKNSTASSKIPSTVGKSSTNTSINSQDDTSQLISFAILFEPSKKLKELGEQRRRIGAVDVSGNSKIMSSDHTAENQQTYEEERKRFLDLEKEETTAIVNSMLAQIQKSLEEEGKNNNNEIALKLSKELYNRITSKPIYTPYINGKFTRDEIELLKKQKGVVSVIEGKPNPST